LLGKYHKAYLGLVAAIEETIEDASITLDRLKSETCKACSPSATTTHEESYIKEKERGGGVEGPMCDPP